MDHAHFSARKLAQKHSSNIPLENYKYICVVA